jgi:hypothetical protein
MSKNRASRPREEVTRGGLSTASIPPHLVEEELEKILTSPVFAPSHRLVRFLRFVVGQLLKNEADQLKEYLLGVAVFDRDESYDPRTDPIVRVEASRLRTKLREYYDTDGRNDPVLIELPKGSYVPTVTTRVPVSGPASLEGAAGIATSRNRQVSLFFLLLALASLVLAGYSYYNYRQIREVLQSSRGFESSASEFQPIWGPFLTPNVSTYVVFGSPIFFASPDHSLFLRPYDVNDAQGLESNPVFQQLRGRFGMLTGPRYDYALLGDMLAVHRLTDFFARRGGSVVALPSYKTTWDAIQNGNIILLGAPRMNHLLRHFPRPLNFEWDPDQNIRNRNPQPGESEIYTARFHEGFYDSQPGAKIQAHTYAIVASFPGLRPNREILIVSVHGGPGLWETVDYLTRVETVRPLLERMQLPKSGERQHFQMLLRVYVDRGIPIRTEYVTHHATSLNASPPS